MTTTKEDRNARARDNQRLSRARRMDYIATLEEKVREFEKGGVAATQQMQASARSVEKQNTQLKAWLCKAIGLRESDLQDWLKMSNENAEKCFNAFLLTRRSSSASSTAESLASSTAHVPTKARAKARVLPAKLPNSTSRSTSELSSTREHANSGDHSSMEQGDPTSYNISGSDGMIGAARDFSWQGASYPYTGATPVTHVQYPGMSAAPYQASYNPNSQTRFGVPPNLSNGFIGQMPSSNYHQQNLPTSFQAMSSTNSHDFPPRFPMDDPQGQQFGNDYPVQMPRQEQGLQITSTAGTTWKQDNQFPNFLNILGGEGLVTPECGKGLSPTGQQFCSLLTLLAPTVVGELDNKPQQLTCREAYEALQHILDGRMSVEAVVARLMSSAQLTESGTSCVDPAVVLELLQSIGVEAVGSCTEAGCC